MGPRAPHSQARESGLPHSTLGSRPEAFGLTEWMLLCGVAVVWGSSFMFMEMGLQSLHPSVIATARLLLGAGTLALFPLARRAVAREDLPRVALLGVLWMGIPMLLFPVAQQWIDSSVAGMINGAMPVTAAAWAILLYRRTPGRIQLAGIGIGFVGIIAIAWPELSGARATTNGALLIIFSVVLYGLSANIAAPLQQRYGALPVLLRAQAAALVAVTPFGLWGLPGSTWEARPVLAMLPLGILCTGLAFVLMTTLIGRVGGPRGSLPTYFVPIVAVILGVTLLHESIEAPAVIGTVLVLAGAALTSRGETGRDPRPQQRSPRASAPGANSGIA